VRAALAIPQLHVLSAAGGVSSGGIGQLAAQVIVSGPVDVLSLRLTDAGVRFLAAGDEHPLSPGYLRRFRERHPDVPDEVVLLVEDAQACLEFGLMRPAVVLLGLAYETAVLKVLEKLAETAIVDLQRGGDTAAKRIAKLRSTIPLLQYRDDERVDQDSEPEHPYEIALASMSGLVSSDFAWMLFAAAVRDAVTAFEVYLHKGINEVLGFAGYKAGEGDIPTWGDLRELYKNVLEVDIDIEAVKRIRDLRHLLTHQRGELRTQEQRQRYAGEQALFSTVAHLDEAVVRSACAEFLTAARTVDPRVWSGAWGPDRPAIQTRIERGVQTNKIMRRLFRR
jgi:hypothetical protein